MSAASSLPRGKKKKLFFFKKSDQGRTHRRSLRHRRLGLACPWAWNRRWPSPAKTWGTWSMLRGQAAGWQRDGHSHHTGGRRFCCCSGAVSPPCRRRCLT